MVKAKGIPVGVVGRCVYGCGPEHAGRLFEEHILAANLGGEFTLLDASCGACQKIINKQIEQPCLQRMFKNIRYRREIGSRRINKRPNELPVYKPPTAGWQPSDRQLNMQEWQTVDVLRQEHPSLLVLPIFSMPGLLRGVDPAAALAEAPVMWTHIEPSAQEASTAGVLTQTEFGGEIFCRLIAKTAHCAAVAKFGINGFTPLLIDIVLGRDLSQMRHLIGGKPVRERAATTNYELGFGKPRSDEYKAYILCSVRIFADLGAPTYVAVVGKEK